MDTKKRNEPDEKSSLSSGCLGVLTEVAVWVVSTVFITVGCALFLFGVLTFEPEFNSTTIFALVAVPVAVFLFIRTGRAILRDLRNMQKKQ